MGKAREDIGSRRFFDEFPRVKASFFRARDVIDPTKTVALIPFPDGKTRLLGVSHNHFPTGGGWSFFRCPQCDRRAGVLYSVHDMPLCWRCCDRLNIKHRSMYGFGRQERMRAADRSLDQLIAKLETNKPLRHKPAPKEWRGRLRLMRSSIRLTERMRRRLVSLRLAQLANQQESARAAKGDVIQTYQPLSDARSLIDIKPIWRAKSVEVLEQALDAAESLIMAALNSNNPQTRISAAKLMMRTKQARERGF